MPDPAERFLDAATRPFSDNAELQAHVRHELEERLDPATADDPRWDEVAGTLERNHRWQGAGKLLATLALIATLACIFVLGARLAWIRTLANASPWGTVPARQTPVSHLSPEQRMILLGDESQQKESARLEALCRRYPDNPRYYAAYAIAYASDPGELPPDFLETARRIDPDNGWFLVHAATRLAKDVAESARQTEAEKKARTPKKWTVRDQPRLEQAMDLMRQGLRLPRFESYQEERAREQIELLAPAKDYPSSLARNMFMASQISEIGGIRKISSAVSARAQQLAGQGDREAFLELLSDYHTLFRHRLRTSTNLVDVLGAQALLSGSLPDFQDAARRLNLNEEAERLQRVQAWIDEDKGFRLKTDKRPADSLKNRSGMVAGLSLPVLLGQVRDFPPIDPGLSAPGRLAERGLFDQLVNVCLAVLLLPAILVCLLYPLHHGVLIRSMASRVLRTLASRDWFWILGLGCVAPILFTLLLDQFTPLGGRDWSLGYTGFIVPGIQLGSRLALLLLTPLVVIRWRLRKRTAGLDLALPSLHPGLGLLLAGALSFPVSGMLYALNPSSVWFLAGGACLALSAVWWLVGMSRALFGRRFRAPGRDAVAGALVPAYAVSVLLLLAMIPVYRVQERFWIVRDTLTTVIPSKPSATAFEYDVTQQRKAELEEHLAPLLETR